MRDFVDRHHKICESRGGLTVPDNIVLVKRKFHNAIHSLLGNATPVGQIQFVHDFNDSVWSNTFSRDIMRIINKYSGYNEVYAYKDGLFIPERLLEAQDKYRGTK